MRAAFGFRKEHGGDFPAFFVPGGTALRRDSDWKGGQGGRCRLVAERMPERKRFIERLGIKQGKPPSVVGRGFPKGETVLPFFRTEQTGEWRVVTSDSVRNRRKGGTASNEETRGHSPPSGGGGRGQGKGDEPSPRGKVIRHGFVEPDGTFRERGNFGGCGAESVVLYGKRHVRRRHDTRLLFQSGGKGADGVVRVGEQFG